MTSTRLPAQRNPALLRPEDLGTGVHTTLGYRLMLEAGRALIKVVGWDTLDAVCAAIRTRYTALAAQPSMLGTDAPYLMSTGDLAAPQVGDVLTLVVPGSYDGLPTPSRTVAWLQGASTVIDGETEMSYTVAVGDDGLTLKARLTLDNDVGANLVQTTDPTGAVAA